PEDGHDMCPPCLGVDHLREALSDHACSNCSVLPRAVRLARLSSVEQPVDWTVSVQQDPLPLGLSAASTKRSAEDVPLASGRRAKRRGHPGLSSGVDQLSTELAQMKALLQSLQEDGGRTESSPPEQGESSHCAYDSGARMGHIGNSLFHLMLGLSSSLESVPLDQLTQGLLNASLQAFALMTRELGRTLSTLVHARRQMWLAQSSLTEPCRRTLRALPVVPGERFSSALECTAQASRTRQQLAGLHRPSRRPVAAGAAGDFFRDSLPPPVPFLGSTSTAPRPRRTRAQGYHGGAQGLHPVRSAHSGRRFPRPSRGQGARR
ncbi:hypothetical protein GOODEAATRI_017886, partial [Goodea atripinnis]